MAELGLPGVNSIGVWVRDGLRDMRNPPGSKTGRGEVLNAGRDGGGGTARWRIAGARVRAVLGVRNVQVLQKLAQPPTLGDDVSNNPVLGLRTRPGHFGLLF